MHARQPAVDTGHTRLRRVCFSWSCLRRSSRFIFRAALCACSCSGLMAATLANASAFFLACTSVFFSFSAAFLSALVSSLLRTKTATPTRAQFRSGTGYNHTCSSMGFCMKFMIDFLELRPFEALSRNTEDSRHESVGVSAIECATDRKPLVY